MTDLELTGGPEGSQSAPAATPTEPVQAPSAPAEKTSPPTPAFTPVYLGGRKFESAEDLTQYTAQLQQEKEELSKYAPAKPMTPADPDKELADMFFEDPATAVKVIREQTKKELRQEFTEHDARKMAVSQFYKQNPDLEGLEDMVELTRLRVQERINKLPLEQAMKELATAVRGRLSQIKKQPSGGVELPSGQVVTGGNTNGSGPQSVPVQTTPKSFVDQLKDMRTRRAK